MRMRHDLSEHMPTDHPVRLESSCTPCTGNLIWRLPPELGCKFIMVGEGRREGREGEQGGKRGGGGGVGGHSHQRPSADRRLQTSLRAPTWRSIPATTGGDDAEHASCRDDNENGCHDNANRYNDANKLKLLRRHWEPLRRCDETANCCVGDENRRDGVARAPWSAPRMRAKRLNVGARCQPDRAASEARAHQPLSATRCVASRLQASGGEGS